MIRLAFRDIERRALGLGDRGGEEQQARVTGASDARAS
jgi:hypothetical protein